MMCMSLCAVVCLSQYDRDKSYMSCTHLNYFLYLFPDFPQTLESLPYAI